MKDIVHLNDDQLQSYFDGTCTAPEQKIIEEHLSQCTACSREWGAISSLDTLIRENYVVAPLSVNISEQVAQSIFRKQAKRAALLDHFLFIFLMMVSIAGFGYCASLVTRSNPLVLLFTLLMLSGIYIMTTIQENRKFKSIVSRLLGKTGKPIAG